MKRIKKAGGWFGSGEKRSWIWTSAYSVFIIVFTIYALMDTFVLTRAYQPADAETQTLQYSAQADSVTELPSESTIVSFREHEVEGTRVYAAEISLGDMTDLRAYLADNTYGKNITATTSEMADACGATIAVNGDYYGAREKGYVIRNGVLYRSKGSAGQEDLVIYEDGSAEIICEDEISAEELLQNGAWQVLSFGPGLLENGEISVSEDDEVGRAKASNPRTAIGVLENGNLILVVSDGRTEESEGLSLYELAVFMKSIGAETAYNLDGGGSSTMVYYGEVVNNPTSGGRIKEREVSDILYVVFG
ncbi:MAG: phosphodiester glycosidase family protein [Clostridia bacterium]|nr:phosphodiester glycosidase family protein [Clostridia bacterium]